MNKKQTRIPHERRAEILRFLEKEKIIKIEPFSKAMGISLATLRRDLTSLEKENRIKKIYGGAILEKTHSKEVDYSEREESHKEEKHEIGLKASDMVKDRQTIIIDSGTTTLELAKALRNRNMDLNILTNSLSIAMLLWKSHRFRISITGGLLRQDEPVLNGYIGEKVLEEFHTDIAFLSIGGISMEGGFTDFSPEEVSMKRKMIAHADKVVVLADKSKFNVNTMLKMCGFGEVDMILTGSGLEPEVLASFRSRIPVVTVDLPVE